MHLSKGCPYPCLYKFSPTIVYHSTFDGHLLSALAGGFLDFRYWIYGVIQLSTLSMLRHMCVVDGAANVYCRRDLCCPLCLVLANLDKAFARVLSPLGICCIFTSSKSDFMMLRTKW